MALAGVKAYKQVAGLSLDANVKNIESKDVLGPRFDTYLEDVITDTSPLTPSKVKAAGIEDTIGSFLGDTMSTLREGENAVILSAQGKIETQQVVAKMVDAKMALETMATAASAMKNSLDKVLSMNL